MMLILRLHILALMILSLVGCSTWVWTKHGMTDFQFNRDLAKCRAESLEMYPPNIYAYEKVLFNKSVTTKCDEILGRIECTSEGGEPVTTTKTKDLNEDYRWNHLRNCFRGLGYTPYKRTSVDIPPNNLPPGKQIGF